MSVKKILSAVMALTLLCCCTACSGKSEDLPGTQPFAKTSEKAPEFIADAGIITPEQASAEEKYADAHTVELSEEGVIIDGTALPEYDYIWHADPSVESEWYEGNEPSSSGAYIAHDIWYYPELDSDGFTAESYDGETEWVYHYTAEGLTDYIFSTLPYFMGDSSLPVQMMHSAEEAYENRVLHINEPGTYVLSGTWHGQIFVSFGDKDDSFADENAKITLILNGADVTCDCAPALLCTGVYECDNTWEERGGYSGNVDTSDAGVNVIIADGTENSFTGANVYRLLKAKYKKEGSTVQKKAHKTDGAFYSCVSMNINGEENGTGILNITSTTFEGLDSELHLTINGGYINIYSQDDGINVNEDNVSVFTMNGGTLHIFAGLGNEGDCVDSNGYITVNGGLIAGGTPSASDEVLDSDCGNAINGGTVIEVGSSGFSGMGAPGMGRPDGGIGGFNPGNGFSGMEDGRTDPPDMDRPDNMPPDMDGGKPELPENRAAF